MDHLTEEELAMLFEAIDWWERESRPDGMNVGVLAATMSGDRAKAERLMREGTEAAERGIKLRKRQLILLKAKLIGLTVDA